MVTSEDASDNSCSRSISDLIGMHALAYGHTSPHAQDLMRRQLQDGVFEQRPALILGDFVAVHDAFHNQYPECKVSFESFCQALPWNVLETRRVAVADSNITYRPHRCWCSQFMSDGNSLCSSCENGFTRRRRRRRRQIVGTAPERLTDDHDWAEQGDPSVWTETQSGYWTTAQEGVLQSRGGTMCARRQRLMMNCAELSESFTMRCCASYGASFLPRKWSFR